MRLGDAIKKAIGSKSDSQEDLCDIILVLHKSIPRINKLLVNIISNPSLRNQHRVLSVSSLLGNLYNKLNYWRKNYEYLIENLCKISPKLRGIIAEIELNKKNKICSNENLKFLQNFLVVVDSTKDLLRKYKRGRLPEL